ncbi:MAG: hypothetical protein U0559_10870 [Anaerolineae bacterium]
MSDRVLRVPRVWWFIAMLLVVGCAPTLSDQDRIATRVAEDRAVAATLTASAPTPIPPSPVPSTVTRTPVKPPSTPLPAATVTPQQVVPLVPPTSEPAFTPTPQQVVKIVPPSITLVPIVPGFGNPNGLTGRIILPGYEGPLEEPVIRNRLVFRLEVFDPEVGQTDGAGITSVDMSIGDPKGNQPYAITLDQPPYCAFAGSPECDVYVFADRADAWPDGTPICAGSGYQANMIVHTTNPERDNAFWGFNFSIGGNYPPCN